MLRSRRTGAVLVLALISGACVEPGAEEGPGLAEDAEMAAVGAGAVPEGFEEWDTDRNALLITTEFGAWVDHVGAWNRWNTDAAPGLSATEVGTGLFGLWDADRTGELTEAEWSEGLGAWAPTGASYGAFGEWDLNRDAQLDATELLQGLERTGVWRAWDRDGDGVLGESEFDLALFDSFDVDEDDSIDVNEWRAGVEPWGDAGPA